MRKILFVVVLALLVSLTASPQSAEKTRNSSRLPRDLEIQLHSPRSHRTSEITRPFMS